jgi:flagellar hook assembly protein FlgD
LEQNYPNPFNPNTTIQYTIPINRKVSVKVYNITGQLVRTLVENELVNAGTHSVVWNGKNEFGRTVSTGMYLYSLEWAGMKKVKRMTLVK